MASSDSSIWLREGLTYTLGHGRGVDAEITDSMFYNRWLGTERYRINLPHWDQEGCFTFETFRLFDSIPANLLNYAKQLVANASQEVKDNNRDYFQRYEKLLHKGSGTCVLRDPNLRRILTDILLFNDGRTYELYHFVVMPNHVHMLIRPLIPRVKIIHSIFSYSSTVLQREIGTTGRFWQTEGFDHLVRSPESLRAKIQYIGNNPRALA